MTQDKAKKTAARQRMAETGEPYSVARRAVQAGQPDTGETGQIFVRYQLARTFELEVDEEAWAKADNQTRARLIAERTGQGSPDPGTTLGELIAHDLDERGAEAFAEVAGREWEEEYYADGAASEGITVEEFKAREASGGAQEWTRDRAQEWTRDRAQERADQAQERADQAQERADLAQEQAEEAQERAEGARERAEEARDVADEARNVAEDTGEGGDLAAWKRAEREVARAQERADRAQARAEQEQERADREQERAEQEQERADREQERADGPGPRYRPAPPSMHRPPHPPRPPRPRMPRLPRLPRLPG